MKISSYGRALRTLRAQAGFSQVSLAEVTETGGSHICNIENGFRTGSESLLRSFAGALEADILELIPSWLYSCRSAVFSLPHSKDFHRGGTDKQRVIFCAYLLRNWYRLSQKDLQALIAVIKGVHEKWQKQI